MRLDQRHTPPPRTAELMLLAVAALAILIRVPSIAEPLGIDQSLWASAVRGMERGQRLYRDVWEQRPPGIYFVYLTGFRMLGWHASTVAWLDILASAATTMLLYGTARALASRTTAALTAALYAALTVPGWLYRNDGFLERSVCETFFVVCVSAAAWCAVRLRTGTDRLLAASAGLALGAAVVLKPNAGLYAPALLGWTLFTRPLTGGAWRARISVAGWMIAGSLVAPLLTLAWLWRLDLLADARVAVIDFNRYYVGEGFTLGGIAWKMKDAIGFRLKTSPDPLWLGGAIGAIAIAVELARRRRLDPIASLAAWWGAAAAFVIAVNGIRPFPSYFIPPYAPLALLSAWTISRWSPDRTGARVAAIAVVLLMAFAMASQHYVSKIVEPAIAGVATLRGELPRAEYLQRFGGYADGKGHSPLANEQLAAFVRAHTQPEERVFLFGISGAGVYFLADRLPAQRFLRANFFVGTDFADPAFRLGPVIEELSQHEPRYLIFEQLHSGTAAPSIDPLPRDPLVQPLLHDYEFETQIEDFALYRRLPP